MLERNDRIRSRVHSRCASRNLAKEDASSNLWLLSYLVNLTRKQFSCEELVHFTEQLGYFSDKVQDATCSLTFV